MGLFSSKKDLVRIIYRAEITSGRVNEAVSSRLDSYVADLTDLDFNGNKKTIKELKNISRRLANAENKDKVYKDIIPDDVLSFIKEADSMGVKSSAIIEEYAPIKQIGEAALSKVKKKMYFPFATFFVAVLMFNYLVGEFLPIATSGTIYFSDTIQYIMKNYMMLNFSYGAFFALFFLGFPEKMPMISKIFNEINGMLALSTIMILHNLSYSASEMIPSIANRFKLQKLIPKTKDMEGLTKMLYKGKLLSVLQASEIRNSGSVTGELHSVLAVVFEEKRQAVIELDEMIQEVVKNITIFLIVAPLFSMLAVLGALFQGVMSLM